MKKFEIRINYSEEMEELSVRKSYYENDCFIDIKNMNDVKMALCQYLDELAEDLESVEEDECTE